MNGNVGIGTWVPNSSLSVNGSISVKTVSVNSGASPYTVLASDNIILVTTGGGGVTITLPTAGSASGRIYQIKKVDSGAGTLTVSGNGSNIDGASTITTATQYQSFTVVSDGTQWWAV